MIYKICVKYCELKHFNYRAKYSRQLVSVLNLEINDKMISVKQHSEWRNGIIQI